MSRWRPLLRIARRDALRARGRSLLVTAMIALPVLGMTAIDVTARSAQLDPPERATRELGQMQAKITQGGGGRVVQTPNADAATIASAPGDAMVAVDPTNVRLAGMRRLAARTGQLAVTTPAGIKNVSVTEVALGDPAFAGKFVELQGRAPTSTGEVALSPALRDTMHVGVGSKLTLVDTHAALTVTGIVRDAANFTGAEQMFAAPGTLLRGIPDTNIQTEAYLAGNRPVSWQDVQTVNRQGFVVLSRAVLLDPPPRSAVPYYRQFGDPGGSSATVQLALIVALIGGLAALEVILLAGAAFAVGARRQSRALGLLAATGGRPRDVRRVVLGGGLVLGAAGAVVGVAAGLLIALVARPGLESLGKRTFGHFDVRPLELLAIAAVGLITGLLAAYVPARIAARQDPVATLRGRRGQIRTRKRVSAIGLLLTFGGVATAVAGSAYAVRLLAEGGIVTSSQSYLAAGLIAAGAALTQIGLIVLSPALVGLAARVGRSLPLAPRMALRDAARHRARSAPAVAAVLAAVTGSVALILYVASLDDLNRREYQATLPTGASALPLLQFESGSTPKPTVIDPTVALRTLRPALPSMTGGTVVRSAPSCFDPNCRLVDVVIPAKNQCPEDLGNTPNRKGDWRCDFRGYASSLKGPAIGDVALLERFVGTVSPAARATLAAGGIVSFDRHYVLDGSARVEIVEHPDPNGTSSSKPDRVVTLPAAWQPVAHPPGNLFYSPAAAAKLGITPTPDLLLLDTTRLPTRDEEQAANAALKMASLSASVIIERGYEGQRGLTLLALIGGAALITLGAAGIATGLAQADARADHATLAAVGAAPRLRRRLAAFQALTIAGLGTVLGIAAGFVPAVAFIGALGRYELVLPWRDLALVLVGLPILASICAYIFTRSRVPLERRVAS